MGLDMQELLRNCTAVVVNKRHRSIRQALKRYKYGQTAPERYGRSTQEERKLLEDAMRKYKEFALTEEQKRAYNILLYYYFATRPLTDVQLAKIFQIGLRTVHKSIQNGVYDLAIFIYGIEGLILPEGDSIIKSPAAVGEEVYKKFNKPEALLEAKYEVIKILRSEFVSFIRGNPEIDLIAEMEAMDSWIAKERPAAAAKAEHMSREKEERKRLQEEWYPYVKVALDAIRKGEATPEVKAILTKAMEIYKGAARYGNQVELYNILRYYFFSNQLPTGQQAANRFNIGRRMVYKRIQFGIYDLAPIIYEMKGAAEVLKGKTEAAKEVINQ